jgi:hypothetical protein
MRVFVALAFISRINFFFENVLPRNKGRDILIFNQPNTVNTSKLRCLFTSVAALRQVPGCVLKIVLHTTSQLYTPLFATMRIDNDNKTESLFETKDPIVKVYKKRKHQKKKIFFGNFSSYLQNMCVLNNT